MSTHTPGPWQINDDTGELTIVSESATICRCDGNPSRMERWYGMNRDTREANARLIAAAPDLLAACEWALRNAEWSNDTESGTDPIQLALAKARGER